MERTNKGNPGKGKKGLTKREKGLVFLLIVTAVIFAYVYFFLLPTMDRIDELEVERGILQAEYDEKNALINRRGEFAQGIESAQDAIDEYLVYYFPTTNQEHFIKTLELDFIADNDLDIPALTFNRPEAYDLTRGDESRIVDYYNNRVFLPYDGTYEGLIELIRRIESYDQMIRINNLTITEDSEAEEYFGNLTIDFFSIPQDYEYPWNGELPDYTLASAYDRSLFHFSAEDLPPEENDIDDEDDEEDNGENDNDNGNDTENDDDGDDDEPADDDDEDSDAGDIGDYIEYLVQPGDTLNQISTDFYGTTAYVPEIMRINGINDPRRLLWGTTIRLPRP